MELYPGIQFILPIKAIKTANFSDLKIKVLSPEALYCIYKFGLKTWGQFVKNNIPQRKEDINQLSKVIDKAKLKDITKKLYLCPWGIRFKIPNFLLR